MKKSNKQTQHHFDFSNYSWIILVIVFYLLLKIGMYITGKVFFDEGVYTGIAKYFATGGHAGYFEYIRPLLLPFLLSPLQYLPIDPLISGRILCLLLTLGALLIVYKVASIHFGKSAAKWSLLLFAASSSVIFFGGTILTHVLVFTLVLACASLAWNNKWFFAGCLLGLAFLLKFPVVLICIPLVVLLIIRYRTKLFIPAIYFGLGVALFVMPYVIFNILHYSGPLFERIFRPLIDASLLLQNETWVYEKASLLKYSLFLLVIELPLTISFILGWYATKKKERLLYLFFTACAITFMLYFSCYVARLDYRYMLSIIPFLSALGGLGLARLIKKPWKAIVPIVIIPLIVVGVFLFAGIAKTTVHISISNETVFTNAGQALLKIEGKAELYPGPNMGHLYKQWYTNSFAEWMVLDLEGYPCQKNDEYCKENFQGQIGRLLTTNKPVDCGQLYGEDVIILAKHPESTISREECVKKIRNGQLYPVVSTHLFVRLQAAVITLEGRLQNIEQTQKVVLELKEQNISAVYVLVASNISLDNMSRGFIRNLPKNIALGIFPSENVDMNKFAADIKQSTNKTITVMVSPTDDWIGKNQSFLPGIKYCVRGSWDQTIMSLPCYKIDLYTVEDWSNLSLIESQDLYSAYDALSMVDYEIGIDIPVAALQYENNTQELMKFIRYTEKGLNNGQS